MATTTTTTRDPIPPSTIDPPSDEAIVFQTGNPRPLSWGAVLGGAVAALGVWAMLYSMGLAFGLSAVDPNDPSSVRGSSIFTGIWGLVTPLLALFVGGFVAGRTAGIVSRMQGAMHGLVMWGVTTLAGAWLVANILGSIVGGVATMTTAAARAGADAVQTVASKAGGGQLAETIGLDAEEALGPVNDRLRAEGKPTITPEELKTASKDVIRDAASQGSFDREMLVTNLAENTALSEEDAREVAGRVQIQVEAARTGAKEKLSDVAQSAQTTALEAADKTGKAFFGVFGALFLGMVSALLGAILGVSRRRRAVLGERVSDRRNPRIDTRRDVPAT